jgi:hypothetical protein
LMVVERDWDPACLVLWELLLEVFYALDSFVNFSH